MYWKKKPFNNTYYFYESNEEVGYLQETEFSKTSTAQLKEKHYILTKVGVFGREVLIKAKGTELVLATIKYDTWRNSSTIHLANGDQVQFKHTNFSKKKWMLSLNGEVQTRFEGNTFKGHISNTTYNELYIIAGLHIAHHFWQNTMVLFIVILLPMLIRLMG